MTLKDEINGYIDELISTHDIRRTTISNIYDKLLSKYPSIKELNKGTVRDYINKYLRRSGYSIIQDGIELEFVIIPEKKKKSRNQLNVLDNTDKDLNDDGYKPTVANIPYEILFFIQKYTELFNHLRDYADSEIEDNILILTKQSINMSGSFTFTLASTSKGLAELIEKAMKIPDEFKVIIDKEGVFIHRDNDK